MKTFLVILIFVTLITGPVFGQTWHVANQKTIAWDAVQLMNGDQIIPAGDMMSYEVYTVLYTDLKENAVLNTTTDPVEVTAQLSEITAIVTIANEGKYFVGVRTIRIPQGETEVIKSENIAWSDNPMACKAGETFGLKFYFLPNDAGGITLPTE